MQQLSCLRPRLQTVSVPRRCSAGLQPLRLANRAHLNRLRTAAADGAESVAAPQEEVDIEDEVEAFMKRQAELESGEAFARTRDPEKIIGADLVSEEEAKAYCREVVSFLRALKANRDMTVNEAKLVIAIEDPRARERRQLGIEDERGVSRDEMAAALDEVASGRIPKDRLALKCLYDDMASWPYLQDTEPARPAAAPAAAAAAPGAAGEARDAYAALSQAGPDSIVKPYIMGKEARAGDKPQTLADLMPDWVGYGTLYGISLIPVMLAVGAVAVIFFSSLR